jgi:hypothetical protein
MIRVTLYGLRRGLAGIVEPPLPTAIMSTATIVAKVSSRDLGNGGPATK